MTDKLTIEQLIELLTSNKEKWEFASFQTDVVWPSLDECKGHDPFSFPPSHEVTIKLRRIPDPRILETIDLASPVR